MEQQGRIAAEVAEETELSAEEAAGLMLSVLSDGIDHPELWEAIPGLVDAYPELPGYLDGLLASEPDPVQRSHLLVLLGMCGAAVGEVKLMREALTPLAADYSQSPLVQGALFHLDGLIDPDNPKYRLEGKICPYPFEQADVLERSTHLCCASWLGTSIGDMSGSDWREVWNSEAAEAIRQSVHDGSYRYCNKGACPKIQANDLVPSGEISIKSPFWADVIANGRTTLERGPETVNLAYDRTCNLSCPSCRSERFAADEAQRAAFERMQERTILPLLRDAKLVFITGSGDPFASKNFRRLMEQLTLEDYPALRFQIMTNGMLFTPRQWADFPALHGRVKLLKISIDASTGPTHELLRRGARWPVVLENMRFAGQLAAAGQIEEFELVFVAQADNYREMGGAVDLARDVGASRIYFARLTNWGTFSVDEYRAKAVFLPGHAEHGEFLKAMQDPRLRDPMVLLGDLQPFVAQAEGFSAAA